MTDIDAHPRVLIYGAGSVGCLIGGLLSNAGYDITLLGRGASIEVIQHCGLRVQTPTRDFHTNPTAITDLAGSPRSFDIIVLTVRTFAVEHALGEIEDLLAPDGVLITLQNGFGTDEIVQTHLPDVRHIAGSLTLSADIPAPGSVATTSRSGGIALAPVSSGEPIQDIASIFQRTDIPTSLCEFWRSMKWSKLLLNQMANGVAAILDWRPGQIYRHPDVFRVEQAMLRETLRVIKTDGERLVSLPGFPVPLLGWVLQMPPWIARRLLLRHIESGRGDKLPSLLLDLQAGRSQIESDWLYGEVARRGASLGVPAPINRRINGLLKGMAGNPDLREMFRDQPERFVRNVRLAVENPAQD